MAHLRTIKLIMIAASLVASCGAPPSPSSSQSWLGAHDARAAFAAAKSAVPYLPFGYVADGCYARAYYMALEAAAVSLPVSVQYIYMPTGSLSPDGVIRWRYHAATMIWVDGDDEPSIADPGLFDAPVARDVWLARLHPTSAPELKYAAGSNLKFFSATPRQLGPTTPSQLVTSIDAMPDFAASDITFACNVMAGFIGSEAALSNEARKAKTAHLTARTKQLVAALDQRGLLSGASNISNNSSACD